MSAYGGAFGAAPGAGAGAAPQFVASLVCTRGEICRVTIQVCPFTPLPVCFLGRAEGAVAAAQPGFVGSYAPHCWYSWNACPTMFGGCGPHHTPGCPQAPMAAAVAPQGFVGSYAPHCWYSWDACPTMYGCGPHHTPGCPQAPMAAAGAAPQGIAFHSYPHFCPTLGCPPTLGECTLPPHCPPTFVLNCPRTFPQCPVAEAAAGAAPQGIVTLPACVYSYPHVCPTANVQCATLIGCHHTPGYGCPPITIHHCWPTNPQGLPC
jgi:hypothetical protein